MPFTSTILIACRCIDFIQVSYHCRSTIPLLMAKSTEKEKYQKKPTLTGKKKETRYWLLWKILIADSSFWKQVFRCKRKAMITPAANSSSFQNDATRFSHKAFNFAATYRWQVPGEEKREDYQAAIYFSSHTLTTHCSMLEVITCRRILYAVTHFSNYVSPSGGKRDSKLSYASYTLPSTPILQIKTNQREVNHYFFGVT